MDEITVKQIVKEYLEKHGYDGLCFGDCGCRVEDLMPCMTNTDMCVAGYAGPDPLGEVDFLIFPGKRSDAG